MRRRAPAPNGSGVVYDESFGIGSDHLSEAFKKLTDSCGVFGYGHPRALGHFYFAALVRI